MTNLHYNVAPRYSAGSPAMVDERTALRVAEDEKDAFEAALCGVYGEAAMEEALALGLGGIVELRHEVGRGWRCEDALTGRRFLRIPTTARGIQRGDVVIRLDSIGVVSNDLSNPPWRVDSLEHVAKHAIFLAGMTRVVLPFHMQLTVERDLPEGK